MASPFHIVHYDDQSHRAAVIDLWRNVFGYEGAHNEPSLVIDKKLETHDRLFFVITSSTIVAGTIMAGYDGHRGWLYSLAVLPEFRHRHLGSLLVRHAEAALAEKGCLKINLQILSANAGVQEFYESLGYREEKRISMGKRLIQ